MDSLIEGHNIECADWIQFGSLSEDKIIMIPINYKVDVLGGCIINLN
jgi:hypothetical protein